jgi:hypothetical protein
MRQLTAKQKVLVEAYLDFNQRNLPKQIDDFKQILDALIVLQEYLAKSGVKVPNHIAHIDTLITKFIFHSNTIYHLLKGTDFEIKPLNFKTVIIDIPSLYILLRAQLENFLITDFIYCQTVSSEETIFRYNNWLYYGYLKRMNVQATTEKNIKTKISDQHEIERLKQSIQNSKFFTCLSSRLQKRIIDQGDDRLGRKWTQIMIQAGFQKNIATNFYNFVSSYAHSSSGSIFNISELKAGYSQDNDLGNWIVSFSKVIIAKFIIRFKTQIKTVEIKYNMLDKELITLIEFYSKMLDNKTQIITELK